MIQQKMDFEENQNRIPNFIYDDVAEKADMTIIELIYISIFCVK